MEDDSPPQDGDGALRKKPLLKLITTAVLMFYGAGWGAALGWQARWEPTSRASYGYQLGWLSCLAACAGVLLLRRGHRSLSSAAFESNARDMATNKDGV